MRTKAFFINGGAGRVICSIPAFEKYAETHDDFIIVCEGGTDFYKGHPVLYKHAFDNWHKGLFENEIKHRDCVTPEPYRCWHYYNQKCNLAQAFDIIINELDQPRDIADPLIRLNKMELVSGYNVVEEIKGGTGKDKVLVVQPFGRSVEQIGNDYIVDSTSRSFSLNNIVDIINELKKDYAIVIMSEIHFPLEENEENSKLKVARPQIKEMRMWASIINASDHFLGCDSMGQHIAKACGKTATVVLGSTYPENISYPNSKDFDIIDIGIDRKKYSPIRISIDEEIDRYNDEAMEMTKEKIQEVIQTVKNRMGKSVAYTNYNKNNNSTPSCNTKPEMSGIPLTAQKPNLKLNINKGFAKNDDIQSVLKNIK